MIRKLLYTFILLGAAIAPAAAQTGVTWGARLSMDVTFPGGNHSLYNTGSGFSAGAVANIALPRSFYLEPGLMFYYTAMGSKDLITFDDKYFYEGAAKYCGIRVPVLAGYSFSVGSGWDMAVATGPYVNFNIAARQKLDPNLNAPVPVPDRKINLFDHGWKRADGGWHIELSVTFADSYYVGIGGDVAFTPLASYGDRDKKIKIYRNTISITLGYNF